MGPVLAIVVCGVVLLVVHHLYQKGQTAKRGQWIDTYQFSGALA